MLTYAYDNGAGDKVNRSRITWPDNFYVQYLYEALNRPLELRENGGTSGALVLGHYDYWQTGPLKRVARTQGAGASTNYAYDNADRLQSLNDDFAGTAVTLR